ncbi:hypothetical protein GQ53DRAFT_756493 [Thozetella sp. PMI_491]|nr:hypothetical protein GQ53DRAFT_756493 [Thozetella sp. PMI_491]
MPGIASVVQAKYAFLLADTILLSRNWHHTVSQIDSFLTFVGNTFIGLHRHDGYMTR